MKRHYEEPPPSMPREGIIASQSNTAKPEKVDDDYYYCHTAHLRGVEQSLLKFAKIPYGANRIPFIYDVSNDARVQGFPRLSHRKALPLFPDILASPYELPRVPEDIWHFSVASLFFQDEAWDAMMENSNRVCVDFTQFVKNYNAAVSTFDRDALAPIYAHLDRIMTTLFNMHLRTASTLDLRYLIPFIAKIYTEGVEVALTPQPIPLWPTLTKRIFHKYVPEPGEECICFDEDEEENEVRDYDEDGSFDGGEALFGGSGLCETLILKGTPKKLLEVKSVKLVEGSIHAHGLTVASKKPVEVALPLPDMSNISPDVWIAYAIRKILGNSFNRDLHYYCTPDMLEEGFVKYDERAEKGRFPTKIDREKVPAVLSAMCAKEEIVLSKGALIIKSIDKMDEEVRVFTTLAWKQEREIVDKIAVIAAKPVTASKYFVPEPAPEPECASITFSDEQIGAVNSAITQPLTIITGPGGSGKTRIMHEIYRRLRSKYGPSARVMFVSFRNGIVNRLVSDINALDGRVVNAGGGSGLEGDDMETQKPLIFKTCDSIIYGLTKKKKTFDPVAVFMEEAGQSCGAHFQGLLRAIRLDRVRHFILIGDSKQRAPIRQGAPFNHLIRMYPSFVCKLTHVYRTGRVELKRRLDLILEGRAEKVLEESLDPSFTLDFVQEGRGRMYKDVMRRFSDKLYSRLTKLDLLCRDYDGIMGLCPYNDYCEVGNAVMTQYYFDNDLDLDAAFDDILKKKTGRGLNFYVDMRVVFDENKKVGEHGIYSRGQVGKVVCILGSNRGGGGGGGFRFPGTDEINETWIKESKKCTGVIGSKEMGAIYIKLTDTKEMVRVDFQGMRGLNVMSVANFITCDRAQGLEYPRCLGLFPWGNNLSTSDVFYTMVSRAIDSGGCIGLRSQMTKMINTPPERKMTQLTDYYK